MSLLYKKATTAVATVTTTIASRHRHHQSPPITARHHARCARAAIKTRAFSLSIDGSYESVMVPVIDSANHSTNGANARVGVDERTGSINLSVAVSEHKETQCISRIAFISQFIIRTRFH